MTSVTMPDRANSQFASHTVNNVNTVSASACLSKLWFPFLNHL